MRAVGVDYFTKMARGEIEPDDDGVLVDPQRLADGMAIRTKYFDDFFAAATDAGIRQAVILAAGLDARALPAELAVAARRCSRWTNRR